MQINQLDHLKQLKNQIDGLTEVMDSRLIELVDDDDEEKSIFKKKRFSFKRLQLRRVTKLEKSDIFYLEEELRGLQRQNQLLKEKLEQIEQEKIDLKFQLINMREEIQNKKKLLNKEVKLGFQLMSERPRICSNSPRNLTPRINLQKPSKNNMFLTQNQQQEDERIIYLLQLNYFMRDIINIYRPSPQIKNNRKYTLKQFLELSKTEYFNHIKDYMPKIRQYFTEISYKRVQQLKKQ